MQNLYSNFWETVYSQENSAAFMLSFWASMGTFLGGILVVFIVKFFGADPNSTSTTKLMGILQALSGGVMIFMTCFHLIPESTELIGSKETMIYFFIGVLAFGILEHVIIPDHSDHDHEHEHERKESKKSQKDIPNHSDLDHEHEHERKESKKSQKEKNALELYRTSLITFIAMALHNIPEGISVYLAALSNPKMGSKLALAILLHNVPEGMAVGIPLYASTGSTWKVLIWTMINGLAEPFGVLVGGLALAPYLDQFILSRCLAFVAGIMFCISIHELYPVSIKYCGKSLASFSLMAGMFVCWAMLEAVESYFEGGHCHDHSHHDHSHHDHSHHGHSH
jgi:ZIP family zinc transporter